MQTLNFYTSDPNDRGLAGMVLAVGHNTGHQVRLLPLDQLPQPDPIGRQRLRRERGEVVDNLALTEWCLEQYHHGAWSADAGHEQGLKFDRDALKCRLTAIDRILGAGKGGQHNG